MLPYFDRKLGLTVLLVALSGCGSGTRPVATGTDASSTSFKVSDPWPAFISAIRDQGDRKSCKAALGTLNATLGANPSIAQPKRANADDIAQLTKDFRLSKDEREYLSKPDFDTLDATYLSDALFLHSAVQAAGLKDTDDPLTKANVLFVWVCRHVLLTQLPLLPEPPTSVLTRGSGTGLERAYAFLAVAQAAGLEAYLVGQNAYDRTAEPVVNGKPSKGPFWGVGIRDGVNVYLYDPWRGEPLPGVKAGTPATLAEVRTNPEAVAWLNDMQNPWDVSLRELRGAELYVSVPLPALCPRQAFLQEVLERELGVKLYADWRSLSQPTAENQTIRAWNPANALTPVRLLRSHALKTYGGLRDESDTGSPYAVQYQVSRVPLFQLDSAGADFPPSIQNALLYSAKQKFLEDFFTMPSTREKMLRGDLREATKDLVILQDKYEAAALRKSIGKTVQSANLKAWLQGLTTAREALAQANLPEFATNRPEAEQRLAKLMREVPPQYFQLLEEQIGPVASLEVALQLAMIAHDRAESADVAAKRSSSEKAQLAAKREWVAARASWARLQEQYPQVELAYPGRTVQLQKLQKRAEAAAAMQ